LIYKSNGLLKIKAEITISNKFRFASYCELDERGLMKIKLIFLCSIFILSIFSGISIAEVENNSRFDSAKDGTSLNATQSINRKLSNMTDSFTGINNKVDINKENIKKNALDILDFREENANQKNISTKLDKKINDNKANISNIYKKLPSLGGIYNRVNSAHEETQKFQKTLTDSVNQNEIDININREKIDSNEKKLSEYISNSYSSQTGTEQNQKTSNKSNSKSNSTNDYLDRFWVFIAAVLVFFMQAGFKAFEAGMVRKVHDDNVAIKNVLDWLIISLVYFLLGFGFMFGDSMGGMIGTSLFRPTFSIMQDAKNNIDDQNLGLEFFLFQLVFAAIAASIVSGAISERIALVPYILLSIFIGSVIYPVFGHWAWGGTYLLNDQGWLYAWGFRDFAGSTVVHSVGAWVALAGIMVIGPRNGRYDERGNLNKKDFVPSNLGYSTLGVFILWFGWWGFNGGSQLKYDENVATIIINTILSGSTAGLTAFFHALLKSNDKNEIFPKFLGGILGGLVAITACCNTVTTSEAMLIGAVAGLVHNYTYDFLMLKLKLDDPVGAVAVHGFCGAWGTMCVAFFGDLGTDFYSLNNEILFSEHGFFRFLGDYTIRIKQAAVQLTGIVIAFLFSFSLSYMFFKIIRKLPGIGLRVLPSDEKSGSLLGISN